MCTYWCERKVLIGLPAEPRTRRCGCGVLMGQVKGGLAAITGLDLGTKLRVCMHALLHLSISSCWCEWGGAHGPACRAPHPQVWWQGARGEMRKSALPTPRCRVGRWLCKGHCIDASRPSLQAVRTQGQGYTNDQHIIFTIKPAISESAHSYAALPSSPGWSRIKWWSSRPTLRGQAPMPACTSSCTAR